MPRRDPSTSRRRASDYDTEQHARRSDRHHRKRQGRSSVRSSAANSRAHSPSGRPPDTTRRGSLEDSRHRSSYPGFSKAHSRETLDGRDATNILRSSLPTPDATEMSHPRSRPRSSRRRSSFDAIYCSPPSPPLTAGEDDYLRRMAGILQPGWKPSTDSPYADMTSNNSGSRSSRKARTRDGKTAKVSDGSDATGPRSERSSRHSKESTSGRRRAPPSTLSYSDGGSPETTIAADHSKHSFASRQQQASSAQAHRKPVIDIPPSLQPGSPRLPRFSHDHQQDRVPTRPMQPSVQQTPTAQDWSTETESPSTPTPRVDADASLPKVDYLLQHGGLRRQISLSFVSSHDNDDKPPQDAIFDAVKLFAPIKQRLDDVNAVLAKNGSLAVATGYRSVARRLLDRLEHIFNRDISSERCRCVICEMTPENWLSDDADSGYSWGEILELVSGRRDLPAWPPFALQTAVARSLDDVSAPMQKLDPDVPAQYRDHYLLQNDKTKRSINKWLSAQQIGPSDPPNDVDDETLSFAILTRLAPPQRPLFAALMEHRIRPLDPTLSPAEHGETYDVLGKAAVALQRLYRLPSPPRDPECTVFLLENQDLHGMLATLAEVSASEWEVLTSGRFDGFLWSGAEDHAPRSAAPLVNSHSGRASGARSPMPPSTLSVDSGPAIHSSGPVPVALDEETEISTLCDMDRQIWEGMESLESEFEALHSAAEALRRKLQSRAQGLVLVSRSRQGSAAASAGPAGRIPGPGSARDLPFGPGIGNPNGDQDDTASMFDDGESLAPDDSASNIGFTTRKHTAAQLAAQATMPNTLSGGPAQLAQQGRMQHLPSQPHIPMRNGVQNGVHGGFQNASPAAQARIPAAAVQQRDARYAPPTPGQPGVYPVHIPLRTLADATPTMNRSPIVAQQQAQQGFLPSQLPSQESAKTGMSGWRRKG